MNKRIAIFVPSMRGGGAERAMLTLANGFVEKNYAVDLVLAKAEGPFLQELSEKVQIIDLNQHRVLYAIPGLVGYLRRVKPTTLLSTLNHANIIAVLAKMLSGVTVRLVLGQANTLSLNSGGKSKLGKKLIHFLVKIFYPKADSIVAVSTGVAEDLITSFNIKRDKVKVIYDPIVTEALYQKAEASIEHPWFKDSDIPVILAVGRLTKVKGFDTLIEAFRLLKQKTPARLLILGEGDCRQELEQLVIKYGLSDDVSMPGFLDNPFPYMKQAQAFVLSSISEGLPNAMIQAMALGAPIIATDCKSGPFEILEGGRWGHLVPVGDYVAMSSSILSTLEKKPLFEHDELSKICQLKYSSRSVIDIYFSHLIEGT